METIKKKIDRKLIEELFITIPAGRVEMRDDRKKEVWLAEIDSFGLSKFPSRNYKFHNPNGLYFVSFAVAYWLDAFTRSEYMDILLDRLSYCQKQKEMEVFAWFIMSNHVHLVFRTVMTFMYISEIIN